MELQKESTDKFRERTVYIDYLRIFSAFAVIVIHVAAINWYSVPVESFEWKVFNFYDSIVRWAVPVFVMISGALFLNKKVTIKKIYTQNIVRLVCVYLAWAFLYAVVFNENGSEKTMLYDTINGPFHFWYLPMIIGLYICIPLIYKVVEEEWVEKYFLVCSYVFSFILPQILSLLFDFGNVFWSNIAWSARNTLNNAQFRMIGGYIFYFVLGNYISKTEFGKKERWCIYLLGVVGHLSTIFLTDKISVLKQLPTGTYYDPFTVNVMLECLAIFVWFKYNANVVASNEKIRKLICYISKCCLGVFLVHILIRDKLGILGMTDTMAYNPIFSVPVISIVIFAVSLFVSVIMNKIPFVRRYFV